MKQHYLPQVYLRNFVDPDCPIRHTPYLWIRELNAQAWQKKAPQNVAYIPDFYASTNLDGSRNDQIEIWLGLTESQLGPLVRTLMTQLRIPTQSELHVLAHFAASMRCRVPEKIRQEQEVMEKLHRNQLRGLSWFQKEMPNALPSILKVLTGQDIDIDRLPADAFDPARYDTAFPRINAINQTLQRIQHLRDDVLLCMDLTIVVAKPPLFFVTSDNPCVTRNPDFEGGALGPTWLDEDTEFTFPLTRNLALLWTWPELELPGTINIEEATEDFTKELNIRSCMDAGHMFVAPKKDFPGEEHLSRVLDKYRLDKLQP